MEEDNGVNAIVVVAAVVGALQNAVRNPVPQHTSVLTGQLYFAEVMETYNVHRFHEVARMDHATFVKLREMMMDTGGLVDSLYICAGQKIMVLVQVLRGYTNRQIKERWQHSGSTISKIIYEASDALIRCSGIVFQPAIIGAPVPSQIATSAKFTPFFDNCIGALDGTHIPACIPTEDQEAYRNRKKFISQNVLGVANFDLTFAFGLFGWEASAHDSRVFDDAKGRGLPLLPGKYYLGDAGYALSEHVLTPYRGVRYHLKEFEADGPQNAKEIFNLRHSSLRNVIERMYGVLKRRFPILVKMSPYEYEFQCDIVHCTFLLHNFVRLNQLYEDDFYLEAAVVNNIQADNEADDGNNENNNALKLWRNGIADAIWANYLVVMAQ